MVDFDANLSDQESFIQAAGKSAVMWLDKERLAGELASSKISLEASRERLARTADEERRRIQRDLHDGAQQHLIAMHVKLEFAVEAIDEDPARCAGILAEIGQEMGDTASDLRSLASDLFPPALAEYGLVGALASAARRMHGDVHFESHGVGRHPAAIETAVYFVCLEGLQNISKHGGADANASLRLWEANQWLFLELGDYGAGFSPKAVKAGSGLQNMHDRIASVGGRLRVEASAGYGTVLRAAVPIRRPAAQAAEGFARPTTADVP